MTEIEQDYKNEKLKINKDINNYYINLLYKAIEIIEGINKEIFNISELIKNYIETCQNLLNKKIIEETINFLQNCYKNLDKKYENKISELKNKFKLFYDLTSNIYLNSSIGKIRQLNENLNTFLNIDDFENSLPLINNFPDSLNSLNSDKFYENFIDEDEREKEKEFPYNLLCQICSKGVSICFCEHCNQLFCQNCFEFIINNEEKDKHKIIYIKDISSKYEKAKYSFLYSIKYLIINILLKSNYIINKEKIKTINLYNNINKDYYKIKYIKRIFEYPYITKFNDCDSEIEFLKNMNLVLKDEFNQNNLNNNSFHISEMDKEIHRVIKDIFNDDKINLYKETLNIIDDNFYSDDDENYSDEKYILYNSNEFNEMKNKFYYSINLYPIRNNIIFNTKNIKEIIVDRISSNLSIDNDNLIVSFNNKCIFIDNFIRTKEFFDSSIQKIKNSYPNLYELYEYKLIINELLCNQCNIKNYIDYRGNFIIPNKNLNTKRGTEKYYPPYGWFGIGLKVLGKYNDDNWLNDRDEKSKWAIAYHGLGRMKSFDEIKNILKNIIIKGEGLIPGSSQIKSNCNDIRHPGKKVGTGVYLTSSLNIAEGYSGIIPLYNKKYKIILMARVLIDQIREPEDFNYWVLNKDYIRVYRILLKENN